ncbi:T9SS type A sorting domain-containing protein [Hymenobacter mellowenesis]|uniref:T9SS type A sorting domain-containing protein n=1 Tax=Hymenobacter mellowenesis TaxID=3063995 RepID=UPI002729CD69|nr:T9SS type A sorting domain-containing protein [Hymenobacter sp. M29]
MKTSFLAVVAVLGSAASVLAEGSKQLTPNTNPSVALTDPANTRSGYLSHDDNSPAAVSLGFLKPSTWVGPGGDAFSEDYRLYVHLEPNEVLYYGVHRNIRTGAAAAVVQSDLILTLRYGSGAGNVVQTTTLARNTASTNQALLLAQNGVINTAAEALAGPQPNAGGYAPLVYTNTTGAALEFYIEFTQVGESGMTEENKRSEYDFWDFTVRSGGVEKPGRLYSKYWAFSAGSSVGSSDTFQNRLSATFNLFPMVESRKTPGQYYVKQVELAGMRPLSFYYVSNEFGSTFNPATRNTVQTRQRSQTSRTSYAQYPNFVNSPDESVWPSAAIPTVSTSAATFCNNGVTQVAFTTRSDETGAFDILIDLNGNGINDGVDVLLQQQVAGGTINTIVWNGRNKSNVVVNPTGQTIKYNFISKGATINFPVFDAEGNPDGFRVRNARSGNATYDLLYWDDTNLTNFTNKGVQLSGVDSTPGVHIWGTANNEGDTYTVNSWTYGFTVFQGAKTFVYTTACDNDGDGVDDLVDIDDDNDGILDAIESFSPVGLASNDGSYVDPSAFVGTAGVPVFLNPGYYHPVLGAYRDVNNDGINDIYDTDMDGIPNHLDLDADGDGLTDAFEANGNANPTYTYGPVTTTVRGTVYIHESHFDATLGRYTTTAAAAATASGEQAGVGSNGMPDAVESSVVYGTTGNGANTRLTTTESGVNNKYTALTADADGDLRTSGSFTSRAYNYLDLDSDNDGITDNREAQTTAAYRAPSGVDTDQDGIDNTYDPTPGTGQTLGVALTTVANTDGDATADLFDTDSDNDNASRSAMAISRQTADWSEGFDTNGNGFAGDELVAKARAFAAANPEMASYYAVTGPGGSTTASPFLMVSKTVAGDKIPAFLDPASSYYHDDNFNGLVDLFDPAYGGSPSLAPRNGTGQPDANFRNTAVSTPLPVELTVFTAKAVDADALLTWTTASEKNNDHFVIERSFDSRTFSAVGTVRGQGSTTRATEYRFTDAGVARLAPGTAYYRLQQVDADGTASYGPVRQVLFGTDKAAVFIYPNPSMENNATLDLRGLAAGTYQVQVLDLTGRVLRTQQAGAEAAVLNLQGLAQGSYMVLVQGTGVSQALKLIRR